MPSIRIEGGRPLVGRVEIPGSKNAALPMLAATLLWEAPVTLKNLPLIRDVEVMLEILSQLGKAIEQPARSVVVVRPRRRLRGTIAANLAQRLRASVLLLGPLLARLGRVSLPAPGGDLIGRRPIDYHLAGLKQMGIHVREQQTCYRLHGSLQGADIFLEEPTVTGTENIMMAAALAKGATTIRQAAQEQHIGALAELLQHGGLRLKGSSSSALVIHGRNGQPFMNPTEATIPPDELDAGTFTIAALVTNGHLTIHPFPKESLRALTEKLTAVGAELTFVDRETLQIRRKQPRLKAFTLRVGFAPGFPTDLQPPMAVLATQTSGVSLIHDWIYERRFGYIEEIIRLGAEITLCDPHRILVAGPTPLAGRHIYTPDIRAGIAFVLGGLVARGVTTIEHADIIERGYADLVPRLQALGAHIDMLD